MEQASNYASSGRTATGASRQSQTPAQMLRTGTVHFQGEPPRVPINHRKRTAMQAEQIKELQVGYFMNMSIHLFCAIFKQKGYKRCLS